MIWNSSHLSFLAKNYPRYSRIELCEAFNVHFSTNVTVQQITSTLKRNHFTCGRNTQFTPGYKPWHAGTKGKKPATKGTFSSGVTFHTHKKIGDEVLKNGFWYVKNNQGKMVPKHNVEFEKCNGRAPREGHRIVFLNGNREDFTPANLVEVDRSQMAAIVRRGLIKQTDDLSVAEKIIAMIDFHPATRG